MKIRHRLLKWLAMGDMVIMNAEFVFNGMRRKEAGDILLSNVFVRSWTHKYAISMGLQHSDAALVLLDEKEITVANSEFDMRPPARI